MKNNHSNNFKWNYNYIATHKLADETLEKYRIEKINPEETFVRHPVYWSYYVSQYGRVISMKWGKPACLKRTLAASRIGNTYIIAFVWPERNTP